MKYLIVYACAILALFSSVASASTIDNKKSLRSEIMSELTATCPTTSTCKSCTCIDDYMTCTCDNRSYTTTFAGYSACSNAGGVFLSTFGYFTCGMGEVQKYFSPISGPYQSTCSSCTQWQTKKGTFLQCQQCYYQSGGSNFATSFLAEPQNCSGEITNVDGILTCSA